MEGRGDRRERHSKESETARLSENVQRAIIGSSRVLTREGLEMGAGLKRKMSKSESQHRKGARKV